MSKIMLVEDDNSLLEIYEARLKAEGYDIVTARDGEEALTVALKEHPDLIIADVMMPKVSGFDMVDILRSTPETKATKIIMMTALNQAEDKARAEKLGADKYLVKSQVTLEDVTRIVHDVLAEQDAAAIATVTDSTGVVPSSVQTKPLTPVIASIKPTATPITTKVPIASITTLSPQTPTTARTSPTTAPKPITITQKPPKPTTPITVMPAPEPVKTDPVTSMPKVAFQEPPVMPSTSSPATSTTSIQVTDDSDVSTNYSVKDPFLAKNPTLSDSPNISPAPTAPSSQEIEDSDTLASDNSVAQKAVESLAPSTTNADTSDKQSSAEDDSTTTKYLKTNKDDKNKSMTHNKVIEPTLAREDDDNPTLTNLSEISDVEVASAPPPPVNTVIAPDPDKGSANSSQY